MKDLGPASSYLGIWITRDHTKWAIWIDQQVYIENTLKRFKLLDTNSTNTPLPAGIHLEKSEESVALNNKTYYQQIIRTLIYTAIGTRPDIAFAATRLSQFLMWSDNHLCFHPNLSLSIWLTWCLNFHCIWFWVLLCLWGIKVHILHTYSYLQYRRHGMKNYHFWVQFVEFT